jgi:alkylated DNA repair dioxygenase AlkB
MDSMNQPTSLRDGGTVWYIEAFLDQNEADVLVKRLLEETPWKQEVGRGRPFPRLTAWFADPGLEYRYSGVTHQGHGWTTVLLEIKRRIEMAVGTEFNSLLLNRYRDGRDSIGFHADDEPELGTNPVIGSLSLGAVRNFILKHKTSREKRAFALAHGSLLVMGGTCQRFWVHGVPKTDEEVGERINLTFRRIFAAG